MLPTFVAKGAPHAYQSLGPALTAETPHVIWGHGWGQSHAAFLPLARTLERHAHHTVLDFPGFGESPIPPAVWGTQDYADALADWLRTLPRGRRVYVGHSFGCRVALRLAARHPDVVDALVLAAGAGLKRQRSLVERARIFVKVRLYKTLKLAERLGLDVSAQKARFGSADYRNAGALRPIFVAVIAEDQTEVARQIRCPVALLYGEKDGETPPEIGERLSKLIPGATLAVLPGLDHYSILTDGAPQITYAVSRMLEG
ncbi:MAG: alpha/beta fold hydrolase [Labrys sp. (in: a-proteobacteria)]|jgi:pimeloyl-ACP methyl ester carboxylesterase